MLQTSITFVEVIKLAPSIFLLHFHIKGFISSSFLYVQMANKIARSGDDSRDEMTFNRIVKCRKPNSDKAFYYFFRIFVQTRKMLCRREILVDIV